MSTAETVLTTIVTSTLVAGLVSAATGYYFNKRLETAKAELELTTHAARAIADQKLEVFPRIVELIYRIRNLAREAVSGNVSRDVVRELRVRVASLENGIRSLYDRIEVQHAEIIRTLAFLTGPARRG